MTTARPSDRRRARVPALGRSRHAAFRHRKERLPDCQAFARYAAVPILAEPFDVLASRPFAAPESGEERPDCRKPSNEDKANIAETRTLRRAQPVLRPSPRAPESLRYRGRAAPDPRSDAASSSCQRPSGRAALLIPRLQWKAKGH